MRGEAKSPQLRISVGKKAGASKRVPVEAERKLYGTGDGSQALLGKPSESGSMLAWPVFNAYYAL